MHSGKIVLLLFAVFSTLALRSQTAKSFTADPVKFPEELQTLFATVSNRAIEPKLKELLNPFLEHILFLLLVI